MWALRLIVAFSFGVPARGPAVASTLAAREMIDGGLNWRLLVLSIVLLVFFGLFNAHGLKHPWHIALMTELAFFHGCQIRLSSIANPVDDVEDFQRRVGTTGQEFIPALHGGGSVSVPVQDPSRHRPNMMGFVPEAVS